MFRQSPNGASMQAYFPCVVEIQSELEEDKPADGWPRFICISVVPDNDTLGNFVAVVQNRGGYVYSRKIRMEQQYMRRVSMTVDEFLAACDMEK